MYMRICMCIHITFFSLRFMFEQVSTMEENPYVIMWTLKEYLVPIPGKEVYEFIFSKVILVFNSIINKSSIFYIISFMEVIYNSQTFNIEHKDIPSNKYHHSRITLFIFSEMLLEQFFWFSLSLCRGENRMWLSFCADDSLQ